MSRVRTYPPHTAEALRAIRMRNSVALPDAYWDFMATTNGAESIDGFFRVFGIAQPNRIDALSWNEEETWKFAWPDSAKSYWCFGETAWGYQYAFLSGDADGRVYFLDAVSMRPESIADDFQGFYRSEFLRNCDAPYDALTRQAQAICVGIDNGRPRKIQQEFLEI